MLSAALALTRSKYNQLRHDTLSMHYIKPSSVETIETVQPGEDCHIGKLSYFITKSLPKEHLPSRTHLPGEHRDELM